MRQKNSDSSTQQLDFNTKGLLLEYRIKRLLFHMGYYAQSNILLKTSPYLPNDDITDLDVYGYYFMPDFSYSAKWVDCKSGNTNVLQHLAWINGIKSQVAVNEVIFIKQGVRKSIKEYARTLGIKVFDLNCLSQLEEHYNIKSNDWRGSYDIMMQSGKLIDFSRISVPDEHLYKSIANFMASTYWALDSFSKVKKCITGLRQLASIVTLPFDESQIKSIKWAIFNMISMFLLATLEICGNLYYFSDNDKLSAIAEGLVSGSIPVSKRQEIAEISYKFASTIVKQYIPEFNDSMVSKVNPNMPPNYYEAYCDLIKRITQNPLSWTESLRILDFYLMEFDLKGKSKPDNFFSDFSVKSDDLELSLKTILHFIHKVTGVPKDIFSLIG